MGSTWYLVKKAKELWGWYSFAAGLWALYVTLGAGVIAWLSTTWVWYWLTFSWAGVAFVFLLAWFLFALGIFLIGSGVAKWRGEKVIVDNAVSIIPAKKIFIPLSPKNLMDLYEGRASFQGDKLAEAYIGKWIKVKGRISDIIIDPPTAKEATVAINDSEKILLVANFDDKEDVQHLLHNSEIEFTGKIRSVSKLFLKLSDCELFTGDEHTTTPLNRS